MVQNVVLVGAMVSLWKKGGYHLLDFLASWCAQKPLLAKRSGTHEQPFMACTARTYQRIMEKALSHTAQISFPKIFWSLVIGLFCSFYVLVMLVMFEGIHDLEKCTFLVSC